MSKVGLLDAVGNVVVEYSYDAWGKPLAVTGGMADTVGKLNPFRYRGYVWDEETGLYYLRSRYYRPEWGRFVSADNVLGKEGAILSHNSFTYCANQPIMLDDASGNSPRFSKTAVEGMPGLKAMSGSNIAASVINSYAGEDYVVDPGGKFSISMGEGRITTADKEMRDAVINAISAAVGGLRSYVFGDIGGKVLKHLGKYPGFAERLKNVAGWLGTIAEFVDYDPLERMYSWRDGDYTYTRYTWTYECTFLWFSFTNFSITYEIRDYGGGYEEVWMSNQNYIFPSASIPEMKILEGSYD
jgi:RHS repeat-associated protein